jgi:hypothetical protein
MTHPRLRLGIRSRYGQRMSENKWKNIAAVPQPYHEASGELEEARLKEVGPSIGHVPGVVGGGAAGVPEKIPGDL